MGNKTAEKDPRAHDENWTQEATATYTYDHANRIIKQTNVENQSIQTTYDTLGRVKTQTDYKGNTTIYTYDKLGRLKTTETPFDGNTTTKTKHYYDNNGNKTKEKQQTNKIGEPETYNTTEYGYDNRNRLIKVIQHNTDGTKNYTQYHYDAVGNKTKMYTGLNAPINTATETGADTDYTVTRYQYNHQNQMTTMTDPLEQTTQNTYDMVGNLIKQTDRNGNIITYQYNGQGKLLNKKVTKDGQTKQITYTYDKLGNRKSMTDETGTTTYSYDDLSRLKTENAPNNITKEYTYDAVSNRLAYTLKQNGTVKQNISYTYDTLNRQKQVKENGTTKATYTYDTNGNRQTLTYDNSNSTTYVYNDANRLTNITNKKGTTKQTEYNYTYYLNGNQASKTDNNGTTTYQYDGLGRLTAVTEPNSITTTYTFDDNSNRKTKTTTEGTTIAYTYDKNNRLLTETKVIEGTTENEIAVTLYEYDNNGNQVKKITDTKAYENQSESFDVYVAGKTENSIITSNEYDGYNQLTKTTDDSQTITYKYNGDGLRTSKTTNGNITKHIWDGSNIVIETDGAGNITNKYLRGINLIASDIEGTTNYYLYNGHGDVVQLTQTNGTITKNYDYDAFGIEKNIDQNDTNPFRYCGEYYDTETGTIYLRARYYNPSVGRFISEDPIGDGLNWYTYCNNNPIYFIDSSGNIPTPTEAAIMAENIYNTTKEDIGKKLSGDWELVDIKNGGGMKMGIYSRVKSDETIEYSLVNKGSSTVGNWIDNIEQPFGKSSDMKASLMSAIAFSRSHENNEITFVGHSKGGAEAIANAVATNKNCITFNTAIPNLNAYSYYFSTNYWGSHKIEDYSANLTNYVVEDEILNYFLGETSLGIVVYLSSQNQIEEWYPDSYKIKKRIDNHSMESVKNALKEGE